MTKILSLSITFLLIFIAFITYRVNFFFQLFTVPPYLVKNCELIRGFDGIEDAREIGNYIIGSSYNRRSVFNPKTEDREINGDLCLIDIQKKSLSKIEIENFPNHHFRPHGIHILNNKTLFVINHSEKDGENIEIIDIIKSSEKLSLKYRQTFKFSPSEYMNTFNSIYALDEDEFYITQPNSNPTPEKETWSQTNVMITFAKNIIGIKHSYIYYCKGLNKSGEPNCKKIIGSESYCNNGIYYDKSEQKLFVADTMGKFLRVFKVDSENKANISLIKDIQLDYSPDNIDFNQRDNKLYVGVTGPSHKIAKLLNYMKEYTDLNAKEIGFFSGGLTVDIKNKDVVDLKIMQNDTMCGISNFIEHQNKLVLSSFVDDGILLCDK